MTIATAILAELEYESAATLKTLERVLQTIPKVAVLRNIFMNHTVHHRGQLTVYLRMLDVPLPAIYGTSADETAQ